MKVVYYKTKLNDNWCMLTDDDGSVFSIGGFAADFKGKTKGEAKQLLQKALARRLEKTMRKYTRALKLVTES